jgi:cell division protease FtsH
MPAPKQIPPKKDNDVPRRPSGLPPDGKKPFPFWYVVIGLLLLGAIYWISTQESRVQIGYGEIRRLIKEEKIESCVLKPDKILGVLHEQGPEGEEVTFEAVDGSKRTVQPGGEPMKFVSIWSGKDEDIYKLLDDAGVDYREETDKWQNILIMWAIPILMIILLWRFMASRLKGPGGVMGFGQSRAQVFSGRETDVSFEDVAGIDECKEELQEVIEFLRSPKKFTRLGGKIPKGVLLVGEPGTGKTLLARAVAGEASVPFFSLSGSDFVEMFVGVGAARVRDLFKQANQQAPCIIFIDELDALGKARGSGMMGGHEEREQTLNALLVQMDGFAPTKGIILLGATNRPEMLDPALLRAGRFDRQISVPRPDLTGRTEILKLHTKGVKLDPAVDIKKVAAMTPGFVGADLANLANEAALLAARRGKEQVEMVEFEEAVERVVAGLKRRNRLMNAEEKKTVAYHEAGHALTACLVPGAYPVRKVSMVARGLAGLGYTMQMPTEDRYLLRKGELIDRMAVMLGGRAAEEEVFEEVSTGAQNDLAQATELARHMVLDYGMSDEFGPVSFPRHSGEQGEPIEFFGKPWSEKTNRDIDNAIKNLVMNAYRQALELLSKHREALDKVANAVLEKEALDHDELEDLLRPFGIEVDKPGDRERRAAQLEGEDAEESVDVKEGASEGAKDEDGAEAETDGGTRPSGT